ncbi:MAG: DUF6259 domain-containing protein, partial [Melioribacteraceae bacterium]|nr:DUF6259 domain-containing protein [Melioribacteraceae bacterium]
MDNLAAQIQSDSLRIDFAEDLSIDGLFVFPKGTKVCANGKQKIIIRTHNAVSDPVVLEKITSSEITNDTVTIQFDDNNHYSAKIFFSKSNRGVKVLIRINSAKPIWLVEWELSGLVLDEVLVPALGGQSISNNMPAGKTLSYKYPFWWNSQFVVGKINDGGIVIRSEDKSNDLKLLRIKREEDSFAVTYGFEAPAPLTSNKLEGEFIIEGFEGDWKNGVDLHKRWMQENFNLVNYKSHPHYPEWMENINIILELWGARKGQKAHHTFEQMIERIKKWKEFHNPEETLLYLPGFAQNGVDSNAPNYDPSEQCGGPEKFKDLIDTAHELGYKIMIHT